MKDIDKNPVKIKIMGVGGAGGNAINRIVEAGQISGGVDIISVNTDLQVLRLSKAPINIQIGQKTTNGQGSGGKPEVGKKAAEESAETIRDLLVNTDLLFLTCGMGKGTGTGATPIIAKIAKELGILTVAVVTKPFKFEGTERMKNAEMGISELKKYVDALLVIPNDKFLELYPYSSFTEMLYRIADDVLHKAVLSMWSVITRPGYMNVDFADVKNVLKDAGEIIMSIGSENSYSENSLKKALKSAINNPLIDVNIQGAKKLLVNLCGANIMTNDVITLGKYLEQYMDKDFVLFIGYVNSEEFQDKVEVTLIASGFSNTNKKKKTTTENVKKEIPKSITEDSTGGRISIIRKGKLRVLK
ncbi:MAG: cell division protein FtsZ [Elusimicrobiota bacterium]|nr:cell division protein FtsZ [Endomicrobiia bacterium]MCX7910489.1 cell division protein FtsZ [Endomicrobiia bacterium]MDW8166011.1 cell division protein FtsZ [Elusimicrobiota bacterium]